MEATSLIEPGDTVNLRIVRAYRVLPGDIYWGIERQGSEGFALESSGTVITDGAIPDDDDRVRIGSFSVAPDRLLLIQA